MKSSLIILSVFFSGLFVGAMHVIPGKSNFNDISTFILYALMFLVGVSIGSDKRVWAQFRMMSFRVLIIPVSAIIGTGLGLFVYILLFAFPGTKDVLAIGAGFGYYSLSSIVISKISGETIGIIALLSNIIREVGTLVLAPVLVKYFGKLAPIASGGATTSDTTLPIIVKYSGKEYALGAIVNGVILTLLVPIIIAFIYAF